MDIANSEQISCIFLMLRKPLYWKCNEPASYQDSVISTIGYYLPLSPASLSNHIPFRTLIDHTVSAVHIGFIKIYAVVC